MSLDIAFDGVGRADAGRTPPDHIVVPAARQLDLKGAFFLAFPIAHVANHEIDCAKGFLALDRFLLAKAKTLVGGGPGLDQVGTGLSWKRLEPCLNHHLGNVKEKRRFGDFAVFNLVKFAITHHRDLARRWDTEPGSIEISHQVTHGSHPGRLEAVDLVLSGNEDIHSALHVTKGAAERLPELLNDCLAAALLVKGMVAAPQVIRINKTIHDRKPTRFPEPRPMRRRNRERVAFQIESPI